MGHETTEIHTNFGYLYETINEYGVRVAKQKVDILKVMSDMRAGRRSSKIYSDSYYNAAIVAGQWYLDKHYPSTASQSDVDNFGF